MPTINGKYLNLHWGLGARHALYHKDGSWYHVLERFPGALCDPRGFILFESKQALMNYPGVVTDDPTNTTRVSNGIASLRDYVRREL
jgi:5-methylcytosine-specific restriction enzyme A